jgi:hypothetical protein
MAPEKQILMSGTTTKNFYKKKKVSKSGSQNLLKCK